METRNFLGPTGRLFCGLWILIYSSIWIAAACRERKAKYHVYVPHRDRPASDCPQEQRWQVKPDKLSDAELLAILIRAATAGQSTIQVPEDLLGKAGSLHNLAGWTPAEIRRTKGLGKATTAAVAAAFGLSRRKRQQESRKEGSSARYVHSSLH